MYLETKTVSLAVSAGGALTAYTGNLTGRVLEIRLVIGTLAATTDITITNEMTGVSILALTDQSANATYCPRQATHSVAAVASLYGAGAAYAVNDYCWLANQRIKIVVAQGGVSMTGTLYITVG